MAGRTKRTSSLPSTVSDFLVWDDGSDRRYELIDGTVAAMAPASDRHAVIVMNIGGVLSAKLPAGCKLRGEAGILLPHRKDAFYLADAAISCTQAVADPYVPDPVVIFEILSPSTAKEDRGTKLQDYRQIATIRDIVLITADSFHVEHWIRSGDGWTVRDAIGRDTTIILSAFDTDLRLADLYDGVPMPEKAKAKAPRRRS